MTIDTSTIGYTHYWAAREAIVTAFDDAETRLAETEAGVAALEAGADEHGVFDIRKLGADGDTGSQDSAELNLEVIQDAIDAATALKSDISASIGYGGIVYVPPGEYYVSDSILMKRQVTLAGAGPSSILRLADGLTVPLVKLHAQTVNHTNLRDLRLRGNKYSGGGGDTAHGISYVTGEDPNDLVRPAERFGFHGDAQHRIYNVTIDAMDGIGIHLFTRECHVDHVMIGDCTQHGMHIQGSDNFITNVIVNWIGKRGFYIEGGNQTLVGCKAWFIGTDDTWQQGDGFTLQSSRNLLVGCQAQDISRHGFRFIGSDNNVLAACMADNIGNFFANNELGFDHGDDTQTAVRLEVASGANGCMDNSIQVAVAQRSGTTVMKNAVLIDQVCDRNLIMVTCDPAHVRSGQSVTSFHASAGTNNQVFENGQRLINPATPALADDATPSVSGLKQISLTNTGAITITALDDGHAGQEVLVKFGSANFTVDFTGTTLKGNGGVDWTPGSGDAMVCRRDSTNWYCTIIDATA